MKPFRWSKLYPRRWQDQFGEEFDEMNASREVSPADVLDIVAHAFLLRASGMFRVLPFLVAWAAVAFLNVCAKEVQWAAGGLILFTACATVNRPKKWFQNALVFFFSIPLSSLYVYQETTTKHPPLYQTAVAFIPALVGAILGLAIASAIRIGAPPRVS